MDEFGAALAAFLIAVGPAAIVVTKAVDTVRNGVDANDSLPKVTWNILAFVFGVVLALAFQFNMIQPVLDAIPALKTGAEHLTGVWGQVLTGLGIGAVASGWHEKFAQLSNASHSS
jgi:hypothetical protein